MIFKSFIKNLGNGRAWLTPIGFTEDFLRLLVSPIEKIYSDFKKLKFAHFTTKTLDKTHIELGEELFSLTDKSQNLQQRAKEVEAQWGLLSGNLNYKNLETFLQNAGYEVYVSENTEELDLGQGINYNTISYNGSFDDKPAQYGGVSSRVIGNGFLDVKGKMKDPVIFNNGKHTIKIKGYFDPTTDEWEKIEQIILSFKSASTVVVCDIALRKVVDNQYYDTEIFPDNIDGGTPFTTEYRERLNEMG